ncbi:MAG: SEC-C motif-containing protein [Glaciecola sp.]|jgi:SEC-C motif-containing protein
MLCYCCSELDFADCCQPIIANMSASNPEQLMRSRFSAYVLKNYEYILASYAPTQAKALSVNSLKESAADTVWLQLKVLNSAVSDEEGTGQQGTVEFIATYSVDGEFFKMHELSNFIKQDERWFYTTGEMKEQTGQFLPNRNEPCPCGSGKKYKKCCRT